jgi:Cellulase (glycosyl hydrolase family 5)
MPHALLGCSSSDTSGDQPTAGASSAGAGVGGAQGGTSAVAGAGGTSGSGIGGALAGAPSFAGDNTGGQSTGGQGTAGQSTGGQSTGGQGTGGTSSGGSAGSAGHGGTAGTGGHGGSGGSGGGTAGAGGSGGGTPGTICNFASGLNIAWVKFASDVPNPDLTSFKTIFKNTHDAGGRVIRWWFHTNGTMTPGYDAQGMAQNLPQSHIDGVKAILSAAHDAGVFVNISLWSFDMMQDNAGATYTNNQKLLEVDANRQAYIDNYLTPLVKALKGTPGLYSYEIFNEPEGMTASGWATHKTTEAAVQKTVNWFAAAIHAADPTVPVTNGSVTFDNCSNIAGKTNYYSDAALKAVGGKATGTLDFYEVHYYTQNGISNSPFKHPASYWQLDKKLVMGEFFAADTDGVLKDNTYTYLYTNGYNGGWAWSYDADQTWPTMQKAIQNLDAAQPTVKSCP